MSHANASRPIFAVDRVFRLARKELREILRDRRTILTLIAMPLLLYPLMSVSFQQFYLASRAMPASGPIYYVKFLTFAESSLFDDRMLRGQRILDPKFHRPRAPGEKREKSTVPQFTPFLSDEPTGTPEERKRAIELVKEEMREGKVDLLVLIPGVDRNRDNPGRPLDRDRLFQCEIVAMPNSAPGLAALSYVEYIFAVVNEEDLKNRLNLPAGDRPPIRMMTLKRTLLPSTGQEGIVSLSALVPLILILMTITGAVYPAIDLTAGERERGTLEILVAAPVSRFELLTAKYFSVLTVAVLNAVVNLTCMSITVTWSGVGATVFGSGGLSFVLLMEIFALLLLFAAFFSAVLLCLTSFARSFKEAQAYLIPLMLASLTPGILAMIPGLKLGGVLAVLPLVNIVLLTRDLFDTSADPVSAGIAAIVILTTILYALAALSLAARVFGAESVLYSEQSSWSDLMRRPDEPQPTVTISAALWCLALMVPVQFVLIAGLRAVAPDIVPAFLIVLAVGINVLLFGLLPSLFIYLGRVELRSGLGLAMPHPAALAGAVLLGLSLWPLELWVLSLLQHDLSATLRERFGAVFQSMQTARDSLGWFVYAIVIVPAILEELFFRGLLFNAIKAHASAWVTIAVSGLLFGLAHVVIDGALGLERLLPSAMLGLILSAVCWRTGSVWPSLVQHVIHNTALLAIGLNAPDRTEDIPRWWLAVGAAGTLVGAALVFWGRRRARTAAE